MKPHVKHQKVYMQRKMRGRRYSCSTSLLRTETLMGFDSLHDKEHLEGKKISPYVYSGIVQPTANEDEKMFHFIDKTKCASMWISSHIRLCFAKFLDAEVFEVIVDLRFDERTKNKKIAPFTEIKTKHMDLVLCNSSGDQMEVY